MRVFGHPVHPLFIHFPTALLPMDFVLSLLHYFYHDPSFASAGFYCLMGGSVTGLAAMLTGLIEIIGIPKANKPALASALVHGFVNGLIILIFGVLAYKEWQSYPQLLAPTKPVLITKGILIASLFIGNYIGGKLIYQYHIGIEIKSTEHAKVTV